MLKRVEEFVRTKPLSEQMMEGKRSNIIFYSLPLS